MLNPLQLPLRLQPRVSVMRHSPLSVTTNSCQGRCALLFPHKPCDQPQVVRQRPSGSTEKAIMLCCGRHLKMLLLFLTLNNIPAGIQKR